MPSGVFDMLGARSGFLVVHKLFPAGIAFWSPFAGLPGFQPGLAVHPVYHFQTDLATFEEEEVDKDGCTGSR